MFLVAVAIVSMGWTLTYWGVTNIRSWWSASETRDGSTSLSLGTNAPEFPLLLGLPYTPGAVSPDISGNAQVSGNHDVPFPYHPHKAGVAVPVAQPGSQGTQGSQGTPV